MRLRYARSAPAVFDAMESLDNYLEESPVERPLRLLVQMRAPQINGCAYCLDMHSKDLRAIGETEQRIYSLDAWRECPYYSERERAALEWTEAVTLVSNDHVPDSTFEAVRPVFDGRELADLTLAIATINAWNRLSIAARITPGTYQPSVQVAGD
jgi:AhpD family alkylhydroperoxidase